MDNPQSENSNKAGVFSEEFARASEKLLIAAKRFGRRQRMLPDGTIISRKAFDAMERRWTSRLPNSE